MYILAGMQFGPGRTFNFFEIWKHLKIQKTIDDSEKYTDTQN